MFNENEEEKYLKYFPPFSGIWNIGLLDDAVLLTKKFKWKFLLNLYENQMVLTDKIYDWNGKKLDYLIGIYTIYGRKLKIFNLRKRKYIFSEKNIRNQELNNKFEFFNLKIEDEKTTFFININKDRSILCTFFGLKSNQYMAYSTMVYRKNGYSCQNYGEFLFEESELIKTMNKIRSLDYRENKICLNIDVTSENPEIGSTSWISVLQLSENLREQYFFYEVLENSEIFTNLVFSKRKVEEAYFLKNGGIGCITNERVYFINIEKKKIENVWDYTKALKINKNEKYLKSFEFDREKEIFEYSIFGSEIHKIGKFNLDLQEVRR